MAKDDGSGTSYNPAQLGGKLGNKFASYMEGDPPVFDKSMFAEPGAETNRGLTMLNRAAESIHRQGALGRGYQFTDDLVRTGGLTPGMNADIGQLDQIGSTYGSIADSLAGRTYGTEAPGYQTLRKKLIDDVTTNNLSAFNSSGMFGSDQNQESLAEGLGTALAGADMDQYRYGEGLERQDIGLRMGALSGRQGAETGAYGMRQGGINNALTGAGTIGQRYSDLLMPAETIAGVGAQRDATAQGKLLGEADYFDRKNNAGWNRLLEGLGVFNGTQNAPGMGEKVPLWQQLLGYVGQNAGNAIRYGAGM